MKVAKLWLTAIALLGLVGISLGRAVAYVALEGPAATSAEAGYEDDEPRSAENAVRSHVENLVRDAAQAHLQTMGIRDQGIVVGVQPELDTKEKVATLRVKLAITTDFDQQEQIGREVRQAVQRALIDDGYRFDLPGVDEQTLPADVLARPVATLNLNVEYPVQSKQWYERLALRPILVFLALILFAMLGFYLCWLMLGRLWRSLFPESTPPPQKPMELDQRPPSAAVSADSGHLPPLPDSMQKQTPSLNLAPPPAHLPVASAADLLPNVPKLTQL